MCNYIVCVTITVSRLRVPTSMAAATCIFNEIIYPEEIAEIILRYEC